MGDSQKFTKSSPQRCKEGDNLDHTLNLDFPSQVNPNVCLLFLSCTFPLQEFSVDWEPWLCSISWCLCFDKNPVSMASHHHYSHASGLSQILLPRTCPFPGRLYACLVSLWHPPRKPNSSPLDAAKLQAEKPPANPRGRRLPRNTEDQDTSHETTSYLSKYLLKKIFPFSSLLDISFSVRIFPDIVRFACTSR